MKKEIINIASLVLMISIFSSFQKKETKVVSKPLPKPKQELAYKIQVTVKGLKDTVCYLANYYGDKQYLKDTAKVNGKGYFEFTGTESLPGGIYMVVLPGKKYFEVIVDKEQFFNIQTDTVDYVNNLKNCTSKENSIFYEYLQFISKKSVEADSIKNKYEAVIDKKSVLGLDYKQKLENIDKDVLAYRSDFMIKYKDSFVAKVFKAGNEPEIPKEIPTLANGKKDSTFAFRYYKKHYFDNIDFSDDRILRTPIFHGKIEKYIKNLVLQVPDSINKEADYIIQKAKANKELFKYCVWYFTNTYETSTMMGMDAVFVHLAKKYYLSGEAYWVDESVVDKIRERVAVLDPLLIGKRTPDLLLPDTSNKYRSIYDIKAKFTLVYFWDPGCGHCQKVTPKLQEYYAKNKLSKGLEVYAVCTENNEKELKLFINKHNLNWINVWDPKLTTGFKKIYDIYSTPVLYVLDKDKKIIAKRLSVEQLDEFFEKTQK